MPQKEGYVGCQRENNAFAQVENEKWHVNEMRFGKWK